ncbi:MAG TPA: 16S rRNA (cytidine(1402)-2'-O)-methyltransferase [Pseudomonadales bacterium]|nr:16S rRNA (cytidine(1402)-2'-O)-methyltransferase [Pseudomonadales bacterium]
MDSGTLFVVATPIGNLADISERARSTLEGVALIAAEDTRHTGQLLASLGIGTPMMSLHEHNEAGRVPEVLARLARGEDIALVSDAGTPLLADPGYRLVLAVTEQGLPVRPVPGACAVTAALSVAGLPTDRFRFEGFLPSKGGARRSALEALAADTATLVFYEAPHRIAAMLADLVAVVGGDRLVWVGRELTKQYEAHRRGPAAEVAAVFAAGEEPSRGEFVVAVAGASRSAPATRVDAETLLRALLEELPASRAARLAARLTGIARSELYERALAIGAEGAG